GTARPRPLPRPRARRLRRDGARRDHLRRRAPLPAPPPRRGSLRRPARHGRRARPGSSRRRRPPHAARHLLPRRRPGRHRVNAARSRAAAVLRRRRRALGRPARGRADARGRAGRRRGSAPLGARGARRGARHRGRRGGRRAAARAPVGAAGRERRLPRRLRRHPDPAARRPRRARPAHDGGARDPPDPGRHRAAREQRHRRLRVPDHRGRPRRRDRAVPRARGGRQPALPGHRPARDQRRPGRGAAARRPRAAAHRRARRPRPGGAAARRDRARPPRPRPARGSAGAGRTRRPRRARPRHAAHRGHRPGPGGAGRDRRGRAHGRRRGRDDRPRRRAPARRRRRPAGRRRRTTLGGHVSTVVTGIGELVTHDERFTGDLGVVTDAAVVVEDGRVAWTGPARHAPAADRVIDLAGRAVIPGFVDSHTHLVFAGDRAEEFEARMAGRPYDGGGIASTVAATRAATDDQLRANLVRLVAEMRSQGTTTIEVKSGYGLAVADEVRSLRLAGEVTDEVTYLGAHVVPPEHRGRERDYLDLVTGEMLAACAPHARWVDVFCEPASATAFDGDAAREVLLAGQRAGLGLRVHANQLGAGPGVRLAVELGAASADHCTHLSDADVDALAAGTTVATLLPTIEFSTRSPYPDARRLLAAGAVVALAVREMRMTTAEALRAATLGGAQALRRDDVGHLRVGACADLTVLDAPSYRHLAYRPGVPLARALDLP